TGESTTTPITAMVIGNSRSTPCKVPAARGVVLAVIVTHFPLFRSLMSLHENILYPSLSIPPVALVASGTRAHSVAYGSGRMSARVRIKSYDSRTSTDPGPRAPRRRH